MHWMLVREFVEKSGIDIRNAPKSVATLELYIEHLEGRILFPRFVPLVWEYDGEDVWTAQGLHEVLQIDLDICDGDWYHCQRNSLNDDDCDGNGFATLDEAKAYLEDLHHQDMQEAMRFIQWPTLMQS